MAKNAFQPQLFGKFFLLERLGAGGMAEIFRAKTAGTSGFEKELVVKRILPDLSVDDQFVRMLVNEAKLTVSLTHPTIAQVFELGEVDGRTFISMELVEGTTLHDLMWTSRRAGRPLTIEQSIYLCLEVLRGLEYAHKKTDGAGRPLGIIHCDVSPDNVMVTWDGDVKLLDFGIARAAQASLSNHREGVLMGKLSYASPEQAEGDWFDHRVDLFAVGVMFYELLTGTHPFGKVESVEALIASRKAEVVPPSQAKPGLPTVFDDFIRRSLARSRDERFQSAKEMADELMDLLFPTPTIAVAEHLAASVAELYRERIERRQRLRADDSAHIQRLSRELPPPPPQQTPRSPGPAEGPALSLQTVPAAQNTRIFVSAAAGSGGEAPSWQPAGARPAPLAPVSPVSPVGPVGPGPAAGPRPGPRRAGASRSSRSKKPRFGLGTFLLGLFLGAGGGAAAAWGHLQQRPPALVVLSEPEGAEVYHEETLLGVTPLQLDESPLPRSGGELRLRLPEHREATVQVEAKGRVALAQATLTSSMRTLRVVSRPPGATLLVNGEPAGTTPVSLRLASDVLHRFDLSRDGYEEDSFVLKLDDLPGDVLRRDLNRKTD